jgi:TolB-like protein/Flp pilus assembly protein TadD
VFLSYASEDTEAAQRMCEALCSAGIEVWFDRSELRGGDAWDQSIRKQIKTCALFIPIISRNTHARAEGYFRLEWKLAVDRSHLITATKAFLLPVAIDDTPGDDEQVPDRFRELQWTRLPAGETPPAFVKRVALLLSSELAAPTLPRAKAVSGTITAIGETVAPSWRSKPVWVAVIVVLFAALAYFVADRFWISKRVAQSQSVTTAAPASTAAPTAAPFTPPPHSLAVLPFVNMSGDPRQEYFSDGLTEELLNSLTRINELRVAARTSAFSFKGKDTDIGTIARKLNVAAVLEGSVRRSTHTVRITAQLVDAVTGFHVWSQTYDRALGDVLALQTEIATSVANALKVTLLKDTSRKIELGGTEIPAAFDAFLRGKQTGRTAVSDADGRAAIAAYTQAIDLDPHFAMAFAERSIELTNYARFTAQGSSVRPNLDKALADAHTAVNLAPELAEAHYALGIILKDSQDFVHGNEEYERALALAPGSARVLSAYSRHAAELGHTAAAIAAARRAVTLDPLNFQVHRTVGITFLLARQYADAIAAFRTAIALQPDWVRNYALLGQAQYASGDFEAARSSCEAALADEMGQDCLAVVYWKLGRHTDAEAMLQRSGNYVGNGGAYDLACIYAQWGDIPLALHWLEIALRQRASGLYELKAEPQLDPLRHEPRFQAIERELQFPD